MKKFLTKKSTMIGSIVAAAVVFILLLAFCIRPVSVGYTYSYKGDLMGAKDLTIKAHVNTFDKVTLTVLDKDGEEIEEMSGEYWYFEKDGIVVSSFIMGAKTEDMKKSEWEDLKEEALKDWDKEEMRDEGMVVDAFKMVSNAADGEKMVCGGAIATVIVLALVDVLFVGVAISSVLLKKKAA